MSKKRVAIVFGGVSTEHDVSVVSASSIAKSIDRKRFDTIYVAIDKQGRWFAGSGAFDLLRKKGTKNVEQIALSMDPKKKGFISLGKKQRFIPIDVVFPVLHGPMGEDGTIQGMLQLVGIPYVGCGILASSIAIDKDMTKRVLAHEGIPITPGVCIDKAMWRNARTGVLKEMKKDLPLPIFIKPTTMGSSIGVVKAVHEKDIEKGIDQAFAFSEKVLVEVAVQNAIEIEVAILGNTSPKASIPGQVIPSNEFYDFDAKYVNGSSALIIPARIKKRLAEKVRKLAVDAFTAIGGQGLSRVDFLVSGDTCYVNEINTLPGFTSISMYPKLWEATGIPYTRLITELIGLAFERAKEQNSLTKTIELEKGLGV